MRNTWESAEKAEQFLARADTFPRRHEGEDVLVGDLAGVLPGRILDLGCGDGRIAARLLDAYPESEAVCLDLSQTMLDAAARRFAGDDRVTFVLHRLDDVMPVRGPFDAVVSSLAIHHVTDARKQELDAEILELLVPGGIFANLDVMASPTEKLHQQWRVEMGVGDDRSDTLRDMPSQLGWMSDAGLEHVDCIWKWRSLALLRGERPEN
ncbi:MAG TPA: class I SAM-dependent methyltransferase [Acidimicrobiia bacterium]|jgi:SAM-dependent methyltransferase